MTDPQEMVTTLFITSMILIMITSIISKILIMIMISISISMISISTMSILFRKWEYRSIGKRGFSVSRSFLQEFNPPPHPSSSPARSSSSSPSSPSSVTTVLGKLVPGKLGPRQTVGPRLRTEIDFVPKNTLFWDQF